MEWNRHHLAVFHAVAATGRVAAAAERLGISQPAVSKQLAALERAVDARLFDRTAVGMRKTATGELLHTATVRIEATLERLTQDLEALRTCTAGRLAVGASSTIGVYLVPELLQRFRGRHPDVTCDVTIGNTAEVEDGVVDGALDFGLIEGPAAHEELHSQPFATDELVAVAPPDHPWSARRVVSAKTFLAEPYLAREAGSGTRVVVEAAFAAAGLTLDPAMTLVGTPAVKAFVAAGHGVSVLSRLAVRDDLAAGRMCAVPLRGLRMERPLSWIRVPGRTASPAARTAIGLWFPRRGRRADLPAT